MNGNVSQKRIIRIQIPFKNNQGIRMRKILAIIGLLTVCHILGGISMANEMAPVTVKESSSIQANAEELQGIIKAIEHYINAGRKGDSKIAAESFIPEATMSWAENGKMKSVPIQELYKYFDETPRKASCEVVACNAADDIATVRVESEFDGARFSDMFSLVKDGKEWKIVSKIYHLK